MQKTRAAPPPPLLPPPPPPPPRTPRTPLPPPPARHQIGYAAPICIPVTWDTSHVCTSRLEYSISSRQIWLVRAMKQTVYSAMSNSGLVPTKNVVACFLRPSHENWTETRRGCNDDAPSTMAISDNDYRREDKPTVEHYYSRFQLYLFQVESRKTRRKNDNVSII